MRVYLALTAISAFTFAFAQGPFTPDELEDGQRALWIGLLAVVMQLATRLALDEPLGRRTAGAALVLGLFAGGVDVLIQRSNFGNFGVEVLASLLLGYGGLALLNWAISLGKRYAIRKIDGAAPPPPSDRGGA